MAQGRLDVDFGVWGTVHRVAVSLMVVAALVGAALWYIPILRQSQKLQQELEIKQKALKKQQALQQEYLDKIAALKTDPEAVEREIREKLGLVKPGETIYHFDEPNRRAR